MGLNSRKLRLLGRSGDALKRWWCKVFPVSYSGRNSTHVPRWHPGQEVQCLVVTALCWWMRWQGRVCSYLRSFAKPWRRGAFLVSLRRAFASERRRHKMLEMCKIAEAEDAAGVRSTSPGARPVLPRALHLSPEVPHLHKTPLRGRAVPCLCQEHLVAWSVTWLVVSRQGAALGTLRTRE